MPSTMWRSFLVMALVLGAVAIRGVEAQTSGPILGDPCNTYRNLTDSSRAVDFVAPASTTLLCDRFLEPGWYRFTAGRMANSCVQRFRCGTEGTLWMRGEVPREEDGVVNRTACASLNPAVTSCCDVSMPLEVRNCGHFLVYWLRRPPGCPMAYCTEGAPTPSQGPVLQGPEIIINGSQFRFGCRVQFPPGSDDVVFDVTWTFDGVPVRDVGAQRLTRDVTVAYLEQQHWEGNLGRTLRCQVESYRVDTPTERSAVLESNGFWGGIRVTPETVAVSEGGPAHQVNVTSTLPVLCDQNNACSLQLEMDVTGLRWQDIATSEECVVRIRREDWDTASSSATVSTWIMATRDFRQDGDQEAEVTFNPVFSMAPPLWNQYRPDGIRVVAIDRPTARCFAYADPHFQGFERAEPYHLYEAGDFVLTRSTARPFEVQIRAWPCADRACICAVAIQEGNDVISISTCSNLGEGAAPRVRVLSPHRLSPAVRVTRLHQGRELLVSLESGAWVHVEDHGLFLNVEVQVISEDFGRTAGLCGTFDGDPSNEFRGPYGNLFPDDDIPTQFFRAWRVQERENLFAGRLVVRERVVTSQLPLRQCICNAATGTIDCGQTTVLQDVARETLETCTQCEDVTEVVESEGLGIDDVTIRPQDDFNYTNAVIDLGGATPPPATTGPVTEDAARGLCVSAMLNITVGGGSRCSDLPEVRLDAFVTSCAADFLAAGGQIFLRGSVATFQGRCQEVILRNDSNFRRDEQGRLRPPPQVTLCPAQCNLHGACVDGRCNCDPGFTGIDCNVRLGEPPVVRSLTRAVCDARRRPCRAVFVRVNNMAESPDMACRVREVRLGASGLEEVGEARQVAADLRSFSELACHLPDSRVPQDRAVVGFLISVTMDGQTFSNERLFWVFDSNCMNCSHQNNCTIREGWCLIQQQCVAEGAVSPTDPTLACLPTVHPMQWSRQDVLPNRPGSQSSVPTPGSPAPAVPPSTSHGPRRPSIPPADPWPPANSWPPAGLVPSSVSFPSLNISISAGILPSFRGSASPSVPALSGVVPGNLSALSPDLSLSSSFVPRSRSPPGLSPPSTQAWDIWTRTQAGCPCAGNPSSQDCACCERGACQCPPPHQRQCTRCGSQLSTCGTRQARPDFGVDGWTRSMTGCPCGENDQSRDCACCQNEACQCRAPWRRQCVPCDQTQLCGTRPDIFGVE